MFRGNTNLAALMAIPVWSDTSATHVFHLDVDTFLRDLAMLKTTSSHHTIDTAPSIWHKRLTGVRVFGCADISQVEQDERIGDVNEDVSTCPAGYNGSGVPDPHVVFQPCSNTASLELMDGVLKLMEAYIASLELMDGVLKLMEAYTASLEYIVSQRTDSIQDEKAQRR